MFIKSSPIYKSEAGGGESFFPCCGVVWQLAFACAAAAALSLCAPILSLAPLRLWRRRRRLQVLFAS